MYKATASFDSKFKDHRYPFGKLYTYRSETEELIPTSKDGSEENLNTNPIILDEKGEASIYINTEEVYRVLLLDINDNIIYDINGIQSLKGEPGIPGGPKGQKGDPGKRGVQGISGPRGGEGDAGPEGYKGNPFYTKLNISSNQTITIDKGIEEIFITATAGGGSGANYSPYFFQFMAKTNIRTGNSPFYESYDPNSDLFQNSSNQLNMNIYKFNMLYMTPGSGFAGQSTYKYRIKLNKDINNQIQIVVGSGGTRANLNNLNGGNGTDTIISVNGSEVLRLKGGLGGQNMFPANQEQQEALNLDLIGDKVLRYNLGYKNDIWYAYNPSNSWWELSANETGASTIFEHRKQNMYLATTGQETIYVSYPAFYMFMSLGQGAGVLNYPLSMNDVNDYLGQRSIFNIYHENYYRRSNQTISQDTNLITIPNNTVNEMSYGAGGNVSYNRTFHKESYNYLYIQPVRPNVTNYIKYTPIQENKDAIKNVMRNYSNAFNQTINGLLDIPSDDDPNFWEYLILVSQRNHAGSTNTIFWKGGYQKDVITVNLHSTNNDTFSTSGSNGLVIVEYGQIIDNSPE